jgi:hypothetical protein
LCPRVFRVEGERVTGRLKLQHMQPGSYLTLDRRRHHNNRGRTHTYVHRQIDRITDRQNDRYDRITDRQNNRLTE